MTILRTSRATSARCPGRCGGLAINGAALLAVAVLSAGTSARADSDLPLPTLIAVCASCHGEDGRTGMVPGWGRIAGQNRDYLAYALRLYRSQGRSGSNARLMIPYAAVSSDEEIRLLAAHYAQMR